MNIFSELIPSGLAQYLALSLREEDEMISPLTIPLCQNDGHHLFTKLLFSTNFYPTGFTKHSVVPDKIFFC
jgi:hypothetical protein